MFDRIREKLAARRRDADGAHRQVRQMMIGMTAQSSSREANGEIRSLALGMAKLAAKPGALAATLAGMNGVAAANEAETSQWLTTDEVREGRSGLFEACSLLSWIAIAEKAGVAAIPAKVILVLTDAEAEAASGTIPNFTGPIPDRIRQRVRDAMERDADAFARITSDAVEATAPVDIEELAERMQAVMDDLPDNVMVRSDQTGAATLKALAGTGLVDDTAPEVGFGPGLEIGPGWVRNGNRRRVDAADRRIGRGYVEGPQRGLTFVARPWVKASRFVEGRDPHRAGTPFDQPGLWPAEWRAFVRGGVVEGVSSYYGWVEEASPLTASKALEVRDLAQRIVDAALAQGLAPRHGPVEMARRNSPPLAEALDAQGFPSGGFDATLDFIEADGGLLLLEGGPGHTPAGGAHPCAFAGTRGKLRMGNAMETVGVAFRHMPHLLIADMDTWSDGDRAGCIMGWDEVAEMAASTPVA